MHRVVEVTVVERPHHHRDRRRSSRLVIQLREVDGGVLLRARAIENLAYVAGVNRVGEGGRLRYAGDSAVVSPGGETLVEGGAEEAVLFCDVDSKTVRAARERFPALQDRRPEAYKLAETS